MRGTGMSYFRIELRTKFSALLDILTLLAPRCFMSAQLPTAISKLNSLLRSSHVPRYPITLACPSLTLIICSLLGLENILACFSRPKMP